MDIGNGNIASVRLAALCARIGRRSIYNVFQVGNDFKEDVFLFCEIRADTESGLSVHGFGSLVLQRWR